MDLEPDSFKVSTWPRRTRVENSSPSRTTHSAAVAPECMARRTMSWATSFRSVSSFGARVSRSVGIKIIHDRLQGSQGFTEEHRVPDFARDDNTALVAMCDGDNLR